MDKSYWIKCSKMTRERAIFMDCHGEGNFALQHIIKKVKSKSKWT
jgi:hypothetical protein